MDGEQPEGMWTQLRLLEEEAELDVLRPSLDWGPDGKDKRARESEPSVQLESR